MGQIVDGKLTARDGTGTGPTSFSMDLEGTAHEILWTTANATAFDLAFEGNGTFVGRLGLGLAWPSIRASIIPGLARTMNAVVQADAGCPTACETVEADELLERYDENLDGEVTAGELLGNEIIQSLLGRPDLDVVAEHDGESVIWPNHDGVADSLSFATRVTLTCEADL